MPAQAKVGSWLDKSEGYGMDEANESSDEEGSSAPVKYQLNGRQAIANGAASGDDDDGDEDEDEDQAMSDSPESKREANIDWDAVLPKIRPALEEQSQRRRRGFIERYLYVTEECERLSQEELLHPELMISSGPRKCPCHPADPVVIFASTSDTGSARRHCRSPPGVGTTGRTAPR